MASRSPPRLGVAEYQAAKRAAVEFAVLGEDAGAKAFDDFRKAGRARHNHRARGHVGVDDGHPEVHESLGNGALAAGDASGKADAQAAPPHG